MSDKDRMKEIDTVVDDLLNNRGELTNFVNDYYLQTEQVQEVKRKFKTLKEFHNLTFVKAIKLEKQNQRFREYIEQEKQLHELKEQYDKEKDQLIQALQYIRNWNSSPHEKYINHLKKVADKALLKIG